MLLRCHIGIPMGHLSEENQGRSPPAAICDAHISQACGMFGDFNPLHRLTYSAPGSQTGISAEASTKIYDCAELSWEYKKSNVVVYAILLIG